MPTVGHWTLDLVPLLNVWMKPAGHWTCDQRRTVHMCVCILSEQLDRVKLTGGRSLLSGNWIWVHLILFRRVDKKGSEWLTTFNDKIRKEND